MSRHPFEAMRLQGTLRVSGLGLALILASLAITSCTPTSPSSQVIGPAMANDSPATEKKKTLDELAAEIGSDPEAAKSSLPGVYDLVGARRISDEGVEIVYRFDGKAKKTQVVKNR